MYRPVAFARIVRPLAGAPRLKIALNPATGWGAADAERTSGTNHVRYLLKPQPLRLTTDAPVGRVLDGRPFRLERPLHFFLGPDEPFVGNVAHTLATMLHETSDEWRRWVRGLAIPLEWQRVVIRAAISLKLCQHEETGAIVAALTTSFPEAPDSGRTIRAKATGRYMRPLRSKRGQKSKISATPPSASVRRVARIGVLRR